MARRTSTRTPSTASSTTSARSMGRTCIKMGIYYEHTQKIQSANSPVRGTINFNTDANNPLDANNSYANALLGNYDSYSEAHRPPAIELPLHQYGMVSPGRLEGEKESLAQLRRPLLSRSAAVRSSGSSSRPSRPRHGTRRPRRCCCGPPLVNGVNVAQRSRPRERPTAPGLIGDCSRRESAIRRTDSSSAERTAFRDGIFTTAPVAVGAALRIRVGSVQRRQDRDSRRRRHLLRPDPGQPHDEPVEQSAGGLFADARYYGTFADIAASAIVRLPRAHSARFIRSPARRTSSRSTTSI